MADQDRDVPTDDATEAPEPVVATAERVPDVPEDVSTQQPDVPEGADDVTDAPDDAPDDATDDVTQDVPDAATDGPADVADDAAPVDDPDGPDVAAHLVDDSAADPDPEPDEPAWFVGEPEPVPGLPVPDEVVPDEVEPDDVVPDAVDAAPDVVTLPDDDTVDVLSAAPATGPDPDAEPAWRDDPPLAVHLGPLEPETTALTLRPPAEIFREHRRRERRRTLTFLGIFLGVLGMGAASFTFFQGRWSWPFGAQVVAAPICPTATATGLAPADVTVKVYNAGSRKGLAKTVASTMRKRGFQVGEVGNDPQEAKVKGAAIVRHGPDGLDAARTVAAQVDGRVEYVDDGRVSQSVDLVLGTKWTKFRTTAAANKVLAPPAPSAPAGCVPAGPDETSTSDPTPSAT